MEGFCKAMYQSLFVSVNNIAVPATIAVSKSESKILSNIFFFIIILPQEALFRLLNASGIPPCFLFSLFTQLMFNNVPLFKIFFKKVLTIKNI